MMPGVCFLRGGGLVKPRPKLSSHARRFLDPWGLEVIFAATYSQKHRPHPHGKHHLERHGQRLM